MRRYYEFALVVILISVLALVLLRSLGLAQKDMEEAGVQAEAAAMRTQILEAVAHRETFGGSLPSSDNPMEWIAARPYNYIGEQNGASTERGVWYFDKNTKILNYRFRDGHLARFRISRDAGSSSLRGVVAGVGLLRLDDKFE